VSKARIAILAILLAALALPATSDAYVYWTSTENFVPPGGGAIGRANLDGTNVDPNFLAVDAQWVAVDAHHLYWTDPNGGSIGRANLDGSDVLPNFIPRIGTPTGIALDGSFLYWGNLAGNSIGRAKLDGTDVEPSFVAGADGPQGVAIDAGHIYWANGGTSPGSGTTIGRANLDGSSADEGFITGAREPTGVAVNGEHIYWANTYPDSLSIGRADLDGSDVNQTFLPGFAAGLALDSQHLYWGTPFFILNSYGFVGRANLDGGDQTQLVTGAIRPFGVAVDSLPHPTTTTVACAPATITLPAATTCTATVADTAGAGATPPTGEVNFSASGAGSFGAPAGCALAATGAAQSSCQLAFTPSAVGGQTVFADYAGEWSHAPSHGSAAISSLAPPRAKPSNKFRLSNPRLHRRKGTATLVATLPGRGKLALRGNRVHEQTKAPKAGGKVKLAVEPKRKIRRKLKRTGKAEVTPTVTYTPTGGNPRKKPKRVALRLKR
jgi:virginiamycin B lyase